MCFSMLVLCIWLGLGRTVAAHADSVAQLLVGRATLMSHPDDGGQSDRRQRSMEDGRLQGQTYC